MKQVRLLKLELTNYRNIEHEVFVFNGANAKIVGENRIGKTNTLEAIYFLLTNYLLDGSSELSALKPLSDTTKEVRVEGTFEVFDDKTPQIKPREITIKKTYGEKWVKQRGSEQATMSGHYEKYFINGIENTRERDYYDNIEELFGVRNDVKGEVDKVQMLTNPLYLGNLGEGDTKSWQMLRSFVVKLIGDVSDEEIFEKAPSTMVIQQDLLNALGKTEQLKKMYSNDIDTYESQLSGFDSQIELLESTSNPTDEEVEKAKKEIEEVNNKIVELKTTGQRDGVVEQLEKEIFELSRQIVSKNEAEFIAYRDSQKTSDEYKNREKIKSLNSAINNHISYLSDIQIKKGKLEAENKVLNDRRNTLATQYKEYEKRIANPESELINECPTCHRPFEKSELESRKKDLLESLIAFKNEVVVEGKEVANKIKIVEENIKAIDQDIEKVKGDIQEFKKEIDELEKQTFEKPLFKESNELVALREKEKALKDQLVARKEKVSEMATNDYELITNLEQERMKAQDVLNDRDYYERQMSLLDSVKAKRKEVSNTLIATEQKKEALQTYIYTKLKLLDEHIANVFGNIKIALVKENINGGFDPICKPYIYDIEKGESTNVLWKSGSKSEKIITGIAMVEAIRNELSLSELPFLFDEGGEISNETLRSKFKTNAQIICVRVEDNIMKPIIAKF